MQWLAEQLRGIRCLHQLAQVHHRDLIGEELHHRQVMGDKEIGQVELRLQILQQVQDLSLEDVYKRQFPGFAIMLTILSLNLLGDGLRDALDPKLKN